MFGNEGDVRGLIPRSVEYLFQQLAKRASSTEVAMVCSFLEIYNDQIRDLGKAYLVAMGVESSSSLALYEKTSDIFENLAGKRGNPYFAPAFHRPGSAVATAAGSRPGLKEVQDEYNTMNYEIREDNEGNVFVKDLSLVPVTTMEEVMSLISMGLRVRATHETKMNAVSSRSHTVFTVTVIQRDKATGQAIHGMLNLVDLAGSERLKKSESQGVRLKEALHINTSLTALGKVIMALDPSTESTHVPYRDSKLTRVLQNSLGGNSYTSVIAAIHPSPRYYEECLSTLQFANRCRNVRNNPRVNYVDDSEDKDRKLKKLADEVASLRSKLSQFSSTVGKSGGGGGGGGGGDGMSLTRLVNILKTLGINASIAPDGSLMINGKKYSPSDLGLEGGGSGVDSAGGASTSSGGSDGHKGKDGGSGNVSVDKLQKTIKELKESSETYSMRAKERKLQVEEQSRELQKLNAELLKCRTTIKHKEFEYTTLQEEKEQAIAELRALLEAKHKEEIEAILKSNEALLKQQQAEVDKIPAAVKEYTVLCGKLDKQRTAVETPLRKEFEEHLRSIDRSRLQELDNVRKQYEHFLEEKDKALQGFVEAFNAYRAKKTEQLRMAEREIVRLYDYTEQIETILDNVEKGKYQVKQKQGAKGGKSTTGVMLAIGDQPAQPTGTNHQQLVPLRSGTAPSPGIADDATTGTGTMGAVVLPKGLRPINPLKLQHNVGDNGLDLTKKIVAKHKDRVAKLEKMKEEAFMKSLHYAAQTGATATGAIDDTLREQVRGLLARDVRGKSPPSPTNRASSPNVGNAAGNSNQNNNKKGRPVTIGGVIEDSGGDGLGFRSSAPGGLENRPGGRVDAMWDAGSPGAESLGHGEKFGQALNGNQYNASEEIVRELEMLRGQSRAERVSARSRRMQRLCGDVSDLPLL